MHKVDKMVGEVVAYIIARRVAFCDSPVPDENKTSDHPIEIYMFENIEFLVWKNNHQSEKFAFIMRQSSQNWIIVKISEMTWIHWIWLLNLEAHNL